MPERFQRSGSVVERVRLQVVLYSIGRTFHARTEVAISCNTIHFGQFRFRLDKRLTRSFDGRSQFYTRL
jgi:hypothetical protein